MKRACTLKKTLKKLLREKERKEREDRERERERERKRERTEGIFSITEMRIEYNKNTYKAKDDLRNYKYEKL
jgi:hypothetical protein